MIPILAWLATLGVVATYLRLGVTGRPRAFHVANVLGCLVLAPINLAAGVPAQATLNATFGIVAAVALVKEHHHAHA